MKEKRDAMTSEEAELKSDAVALKLMKLPEYAKAGTVLFYAAKGNEVQTKKLIEKALKAGKTVLLPAANNGELEISKITDYEKDLKKGAFGILEPNRKKIWAGEIEIVIVPGLAFDKCGNRLGYGLGYYDKLLHRLQKGICKAALAYDFQLVNNLPNEAHDKEINIIITESRITKCK